MISVIIWTCLTSIGLTLLQWLLLFRNRRGTISERVVFGVIMVAATVLNIMLLNDWLTTSPLIVLRAIFGPASQMLQHWGLVGKE
jgi:hypothetical protein